MGRGRSRAADAREEELSASLARVREQLSSSEAADTLAGVLARGCEAAALDTFAAEVRAGAEAHGRAAPAAAAAAAVAGALVLDVRSPGEYARGHVPGARSLPLFSDEERAEVGTVFKREGRDTALRLGLTFVGPELARLVDFVREHTETATEEVMVYCLQGRMRSGSVAWLLRHAGFSNVRTVAGGYKAFRTWALERFSDTLPKKVTDGVDENGGEEGGEREGGEEPGASQRDSEMAEEPNMNRRPQPRVCIVGGRTGSGKTRVLEELRRHGAQVIDLEGLANHKGSAFGWVGMDPQPTSEHYQNLLASEWAGLDPEKWVYIEDEGSHVAACTLPQALYTRMREAPVVAALDVPREVRLAHIVADYAADAFRADPGWEARMVKSVEALRKKLGHERTAMCLSALESGDYRYVGEQVLGHYDRRYDTHTFSGSGGGDGTGARVGRIITVEGFAGEDGMLDCGRAAQDVLAAVNASEIERVM
mmetsp:Transcript_25514/g.84030  ORF Transcript_25514/g.84030 Transcript_25514/m.84030 type:complete len:481 (+) Transcript_25514:66-1508(+)